MNRTIWRFYLNSSEAWEAMLIACNEAKVSIDLEQFILGTDEIGNKFLDVCRQKAREGVRVRILCDTAGSFGLYNSNIPKKLRDDGIQIAFFNTLLPWGKHNHTSWFFRDHKKLLIIDKSLAFTGGVCISEEMKNWRDTHVKIDDGVVEQMNLSFNDMWRRAFKNKTKNYIPTISTDPSFNYVTNSPLPRRRFIYYSFIDAIRNATKYIYLTTPYFVPDKRFIRIIKLAKRRGVDVRLIIPYSSNYKTVDLGSRSYFQNILKSGIRIFRYKDSMIHTKTAVIDDEWATVGSFNLDNLSFLYNFEGNIISTDKQFASELKSHFIHDLEKSEELMLDEWKKRPFIEKLLETLIKPVRKIL
ncbi:MAG: phospholipase D-like domain-containing protein [Patescibacteria group bacterium]|nr:phospholipase D-like domain-containing protein [Patescibacteria group bacterium]